MRLSKVEKKVIREQASKYLDDQIVKIAEYNEKYKELEPSSGLKAKIEKIAIEYDKKVARINDNQHRRVKLSAVAVAAVSTILLTSLAIAFATKTVEPRESIVLSTSDHDQYISVPDNNTSRPNNWGLAYYPGYLPTGYTLTAQSDDTLCYSNAKAHTIIFSVSDDRDIDLPGENYVVNGITMIYREGELSAARGDELIMLTTDDPKITLCTLIQIMYSAIKI